MEVNLNHNSAQIIEKIMSASRGRIQTSFKQISAGDLHEKVAEYQQKVKDVVVRKIAKNWNPLMLGALIVSDRGDRDYYIINGQHRVKGTVAAGRPYHMMNCLVLSGLTYEEEAEIFRVMNFDVTNPTAQDRFRARLEAKESAALDIVNQVEGVGFSINLENSVRHGGRIPGVGALVKVHKEYAAGMLVEVLQIIRDAWGVEVGPKGTLVDGLASFISHYKDHPNYSRKILTGALSRSTQELIHAEAGDYRRVTGKVHALAVSATILKKFNHRLADHNRLPSMEEMQVIKKANRISKKARA